MMLHLTLKVIRSSISRRGHGTDLKHAAAEAMGLHGWTSSLSRVARPTYCFEQFLLMNYVKLCA